MTFLFAKCPYCKSNFMVLDSETGNAECLSCGKEREFAKEDIVEAEARRDKLSGAYLDRITELYEKKDYKGMADVVKEVANEGISSWYAWFCIGWSDLHEGKTSTAFEDFSFATNILDEENFDEFYELVMEAVLDSMEECAREGKDWNTEDTTLVVFAGDLAARFDYLSEDDFVCDLLLRMGMLVDSIDSKSMCARLINEVSMIVLDYLSGNLLVTDRQTALRNACVTIESMDEKMQSLGNDGKIPLHIAKALGTEFISFMEMLIKDGDRLESEYSEEQLFALCDYWVENDYGEVFDCLQDAFSFHLGYITSGGRNKGIMKKRDKALEEYMSLFEQPLIDGRAAVVVEPEENGDYDAECPNCGNHLKADENGLMVCVCGFKSRIVTKEIDNLPEKIPELIPMGSRAYQDRDPVALNNIGERISSIDGKNWYGALFVGLSCIIDGELPEGMMLFSQAAETVTEKDADKFCEITINEVGTALSNVDDMDNMAAVFVLPILLESIAMGGAKDKNIALGLIEKLSEGKYDGSMKGYVAEMVVNPTITSTFINDTRLVSQRAVCVALSILMDSIEKGVAEIRKDEDELKDDTLSAVRTNRDLLNHMVASIDRSVADMDEGDKGFVAGYWRANKEEYENLVNELIPAFCFDNDIAYSPNSKVLLKSKHIIDTYLKEYMSAKNS